MNEIESIHMFDNFAFFKEHFYNVEPIKYVSFNESGVRLEYDARTSYLYDFYIKSFGKVYIEDKVEQIKNKELKAQLQLHLNYCKNYETHKIDEFEEFCNRLYVRRTLFSQLKRHVPFFRSVSELNDFLTTLKGYSNYIELASVSVAYFFEKGVDDDSAENFWFYITQYYCRTLGLEMGLKESLSVFERANDLLDHYGSSIRIPSKPYSYPQPLISGIDMSDFEKTYAEMYSKTIETDENHIHIGKQIFFKKYMQLFPLYVNFRKIKGHDFLKEGSPIESEEFLKHCNLFNYVFDNYYRSECHRFRDYLNMLDCEFLYDKLSSYVPVSYFSIDYFIKHNYDIDNVKYSFERYAAILLIYWLYDKDDYSYADTLLVHNLLYRSLQNTERKPQFPHLYCDDYLGQSANDIIKEANKLGGRFNVPLIPMTQTGIDDYKEKGTFSLPWKYVTFHDGYLLLFHPLHIGDKKKPAFRLVLSASKFTYNSIKLYFVNTVPLLKVKAEGGVIKKVEDNSALDLEKYVQTIMHRTSRNKVKIEIKRISHNSRESRHYSPVDIENLPQIKKSYYLNELCKMHLSKFKVYHFNELRATSSSSVVEYVFCFVIKEYRNRIILAVENTLESRSTILFYIRKGALNEALNSINFFLSSNEINKRQSLQWGEVQFKDPSIIEYRRIIHTSFYEWRNMVRRYMNGLE